MIIWLSCKYHAITLRWSSNDYLMIFSWSSDDHLVFIYIYRPPDEVTTILSRKLVEEKIKKKRKTRSFNFRSRCKRVSSQDGWLSLYDRLSLYDSLLGAPTVLIIEPHGIAQIYKQSNCVDSPLVRPAWSSATVAVRLPTETPSYSRLFNNSFTSEDL